MRASRGRGAKALALAEPVARMGGQPRQAVEHDGERNPVGDRRGDRGAVDADQRQQCEDQDYREDHGYPLRPCHDRRVVPAPQQIAGDPDRRPRKRPSPRSGATAGEPRRGRRHRRSAAPSSRRLPPAAPAPPWQGWRWRALRAAAVGGSRWSPHAGPPGGGMPHRPIAAISGIGSRESETAIA